jgi:ribonuclease P protein component
VAAQGDERFSRRDRLRSRRDFERLAREGARRSSPYFVVLLSRGPRRASAGAGLRARLGVTASRKVGGAVVRNRVKRRIRDAFRRRRGLLPAELDVVVIARPGAASLSGPAVAEELGRLLGGERHP